MTTQRWAAIQIFVLAVVLVALGVWLSGDAHRARAAAPLTHGFILEMHFKDMGGGGDMEAKIKATSPGLCKSLRRAIWSQLQDADGFLGECEPLATPIPK